jgi:NTE family protein
MPSPLNLLDPFNLKQQVSRLDDVRALGGRFVSNLDAARVARRALLPLPVVDRPAKADTKIFPPFKARPIPSLRNKRVGLLLSGGSGACVSAVGVARARGGRIEPTRSRSARVRLWGSMMASGWAQEMVNQSLNWQPEDYLDIQWTRIPRFALAAMRGFTGLAKGEAIEKLFDSQLWHMTLGQTPVPIYSEVYNIDLNRLEVFGSKLTPDITIAELVRIAIALPMLVESVRVEGHLYADGGAGRTPAEPLPYERRRSSGQRSPRSSRRGHLGLDGAHDGLLRQPADR